MDLLRSPLGASTVSIGAFLRALIAKLAGVAPDSVVLRSATGSTLSGGVLTSSTTTELSDGDALNSGAGTAASATCSGAGSTSAALNVTLSVTVPPVLLAALGGSGTNASTLAALAAGIQDHALASLNAPPGSAPANVSALVSGLAACTGVAPGLVAAPAGLPLVITPTEESSQLDGRAVGAALGAVGGLLLLGFMAWKLRHVLCACCACCALPSSGRVAVTHGHDGSKDGHAQGAPVDGSIAVAAEPVPVPQTGNSDTDDVASVKVRELQSLAGSSV